MLQNPGQGESRGVIGENRSGAYVLYVSTGSAANRVSQAVMAWIMEYPDV